MRTPRLVASLVLFGGLLALAGPVAAIEQQPAAQQKSAQMLVGMVIAIHGKSLTIKPDSGPSVEVAVSDTAHILRANPGEKTVSEMTPIPFSEISLGDRVLVALHPNPNGTGQLATTVVAMKRSAIVRQQLEEQAAWREHGRGGIVKSIDLAAGTVTILSRRQTIVVRTTPKTVIRRYSPTSIRYSDSKLSALDQVRPGDQLRVLGVLSTDGKTIDAEKMVAGTFRNVAGEIVSVNAQSNSITVTDAATHAPVVIQITPDTQMHKLPPGMSKVLAARFKKRRNSKHSATVENTSESTSTHEPQTASLSQLLQRTPTIQTSDLRKGDAVMIVASQEKPGSLTADTLLSGVERFVNASPSDARSLFSASWSLGGQGGQGGGQSSGGAPSTNH